MARAPDRPGDFDALAQLLFAKADAHVDHVSEVAARVACARIPRRGFDDEFDGFVAQLALRGDG